MTKEGPPEPGIPALESKELKSFTYTAVDGTGKNCMGEIKASNIQDAIEKLKQMGLFQVKAEEDLENKTISVKGRLASYWNRLKPRTQKVVQAVTAATLLSGGAYGAKKGGEYLGGVKYEDANAEAEIAQHFSKEKNRDFYMLEAENVNKEKNRLKEKAEEEKRLADVKKAAEIRLELTNTPPTIDPAPQVITPEPATTNTPPVTPEKPPTIEEIKQTINEALEKQQKAFSNQLATIKSETPAQPKPNIKTQAELMEETRERIEKGVEFVSSDERAELRRWDNKNKPKKSKEIEKPAPAVQENKITTGQTMQIGSMEKAPEGVIVTSRGEGGYNIISSSNPNGLGIYNTEGVQGERILANNPLGLTPKMFEEFQTVYEGNLAKIFSKFDNGEKSWNKIKDKKAIQFMKKTDKKDYEEALSVYIEKLKEKSVLTPNLGETIEGFIKRALQKLAKYQKLNEVMLE